MRTKLAGLGAAVLLASAASTTLLSGYAAAAPVTITQQKLTCTHTSTGTCIRGGQFCPQASYNHVGIDAVGRRYTCKGDRTHPHWMR